MKSYHFKHIGLIVLLFTTVCFAKVEESNISELLDRISVKIIVSDVMGFKSFKCSGVVIVSTPTEALILSTFHKDDKELRNVYVFSQGKIFKASIYEKNYTIPNFVLLKTPPLPIPDFVLPFGKAEKGMKVYYKGYPHGVAQKEEGKFVEIEKELRIQGYTRFGSSGAGVINEKGELIGLIETTSLVNESRLIPAVNIFEYLWKKKVLIWKPVKGEMI